MAISDQDFQNHVFNNKAEFANRQILYKGSGNPNVSVEGAVNNAPTGTFYYDTVANLRYQKEGFTPTDWVEVGTGGSTPVVQPWTVIDQNSPAVAGERYLADTTGGSFTLTLPNPPTISDMITIVPLYPSYDTSPLMIDGNGSNIMGDASDLIVDQLGVAIELYYVGTVGTDDIGWAVIKKGDTALINNIDDNGVGLYIELTEGGTPTHAHSAALTSKNISDLIDGTVSSVTITSSTTTHSHDIVCEYSQGSIIVTGIQSNHAIAHTARIVNSNKILNPWEVVTTADAVGNYQLNDADRILADSTGGSFNLELPLNPVDGEIVAIAPLHPTYALSPVTILRNGQDINGVSDDVVLNQIGMSIEMVFVGGLTGWAIIDKGETTIINNLLVDSGLVVATQPGDNIFTGDNDFTGGSTLIAAPSVDANPATMKFVIDEIAASTPVGVAYLGQSNIFTSSNDFTASSVTVGAPISANNPTTKTYVDTEIANNVPTGVALLTADNTFTGANTFSNSSFVVSSQTGNNQAGVNVNASTVTVTHGEFSSFEVKDSQTNQPSILLSKSSINLGMPSQHNMLFRGIDLEIDVSGTITLGTTGTIEVDAPLNINAANGGEFNIVDVPGSTLVLQSGGDFEVTAGGGSLWLQGLRMPNADGTAGYALATDGNGSLYFKPAEQFDISADYTMTGDWIMDLSSLTTSKFLVTDDSTLVSPTFTSGVLYNDTPNITEILSKVETGGISMRTGMLYDAADSETATNSMSFSYGALESSITLGFDSGALKTKIDINSPITTFTGETITLDAPEVILQGDPTDNLGAATKQMVDPAVQVVTADNYTLVATDHRTTIEFTSNNIITLNVPDNLGDNFSFTAIQMGDGKIVWTGSGTATVNNVDSHIRTRGKYSMVTFVSRLEGQFVVGGATE